MSCSLKGERSLLLEREWDFLTSGLPVLERDLAGLGLLTGDLEGNLCFAGNSELLEWERDLSLERERDRVLDLNLSKCGLGLLEYDFLFDREDW